MDTHIPLDVRENALVAFYGALGSMGYRLGTPEELEPIQFSRENLRKLVDAPSTGSVSYGRITIESLHEGKKILKHPTKNSEGRKPSLDEALNLLTGEVDSLDLTEESDSEYTIRDSDQWVRPRLSDQYQERMGVWEHHVMRQMILAVKEARKKGEIREPGRIDSRL